MGANAALHTQNTINEHVRNSSSNVGSRHYCFIYVTYALSISLLPQKAYDVLELFHSRDSAINILVRTLTPLLHSIIRKIRHSYLSKLSE